MANSIQQLKMCEAFYRIGVDVEFVYPKPFGNSAPDWTKISEYYGLSDAFPVRSLPTLSSNRFIPQIPFFFQAITVTLWVMLQIFSGRISRSDTIFGRNYYAIFFLTQLRKLIPAKRRPSIYVEWHNPEPQRRGRNRFFRDVDGVVCITNLLKEYLVDEFSIKEERVFVAPDGVDLTQYGSMRRNEARSHLDIPDGEDVVMYTGHLYGGKGAHVLAESASRIDAEVYIVGGHPEDTRILRDTFGDIDNLTITGFVEPAQITIYQQAADVLVAPYTEESRQYISPLKLFEYMAAGKPIVASQLPVLEEVLIDGKNSILVEPDSTKELTEAINRLLNDKELSKRLSQAVQENVHRYTWETRAENVLGFMEGR